jgi:hypothetical protein
MIEPVFIVATGWTTDRDTRRAAPRATNRHLCNHRHLSRRRFRPTSLSHKSI